MNIYKRKGLPLLLIFIFICAMYGNCFAAENASDLDTVIQLTLKNNPEISAFKKKYEAANARIPQAGSLQDPTIAYEHDRISADRMLSGDPMDVYSISQELPFPTKIFLRAKIASSLAKVAYQNYKAKEREVVAAVKSAYSELFMVYRLIEITKENKATLDQLNKSVTARYETNKAVQADVLKVQVELAKIDNELVLLEQRRLSTQARLNILLNNRPNVDLGVPIAQAPIKFEKKVEDFFDLAKGNNPELKAYGFAIERGKAAYSLSTNEYLPDFEVKFKQMTRDGKADGGAWAGMIGVTIPLWFFQKQAFGVKEMRSELQMVEAEYTMKENQVLYDVQDSFAKVQANKNIVELYETSFLPQAKAMLNSALKGFESQDSLLLNVLDSQRLLSDLLLDHYRAILELRIALADLERSVGIDLDFAQ